MRLFLIVFVVLLVGGAAAMFFVGAGSSGGLDFFHSEPAGTPVRIESAGTRPLVESVTAPGEVEPLTKVDISAEVSARIIELPFREGQAVHKGDVIIRLDDRDLNAALSSAKARRDGERYRLESERSRLTGLLSTYEFARRQLQRQEELLKTGDVSRKAFDDAQERFQDLQSGVDSTRHAISVIESSLEASEADILRAEEGLGRTIMHAPMDGLVTKLNAEVGELVMVGTMNNAATVIMTIADLSRMILKARVAESDIAKIETGQRATLHINAYADETFSGVVSQVALQRTRTVSMTGGGGDAGTFEVEVAIESGPPGSRRLLSGLAADVKIEIKTHDGVVVPSQAIVDRPVEKLPARIADDPLVDRSKRSTSVVFRVIDGKAVCTPVRVGASDETHTIVLSGLKDAESVVVGPYKTLASIEDQAAVKREGEKSAEEDGDKKVK